VPQSDKNPVTIVNVGYRSTNFWVVSAGRSRLLVDLGWPGMFSALEAELKRKDIPLKEITHGLATHYHIDHAGAAQDVKNAGMRLIVTPEQVPVIEMMKKWTKPADNYTPIRITDNVVVSCADSRVFLAKLGIRGEIVHTPGHSEDSVSLLLDSGEVFTGDLTMPNMIAEENEDLVLHSWRTLKVKGATRVYGGHGPIHDLPAV
jgi:ribonuclease/clavin/mitogillin